MRIKTNCAKKVCDMGSCRNIACHCICHENVNQTIDICYSCLMKLYKGIKKVIYEKNSEKRK